jgi:hypothetical protein
MRKMVYAVVATWLFGLATQASAANFNLGTFSPANCAPSCTGMFGPGTNPSETPGLLDDDYSLTVIGGVLTGTITIVNTDLTLQNPVSALYEWTPSYYPEPALQYATETTTATSEIFTINLDEPLTYQNSWDPTATNMPGLISDYVYPPGGTSGLYFFHFIGETDVYPPTYEGSYSFTLTPETAATPLPAAFSLFAGGLAALGLLGWRRKQRTSRIYSRVVGF